MAKSKPFAAMPFPLGKVTATAGAPVQIGSNFTDLASEGVNSLWIQALATNTNPVYILSQQTAIGKDTTAYSNIAFVLTAGQGIAVNGKYGNQVILGYLWVDPTTTGEGVFATIQEV